MPKRVREDEKPKGKAKKKKMPKLSKEAKEYVRAQKRLDRATEKQSPKQQQRTVEDLFDDSLTHCPSCKSELTLDTEMVCTACGFVTGYITNLACDNLPIQKHSNEENGLTKKENTGYERVQFANRYTPLSHLNEVLEQKGGYGGTVSEKCINDIRNEYTKWKIPFENATDMQTLFFLRRTGHCKVYEHRTQITHSISKKAPKWNLDARRRGVITLRFNQAVTAWRLIPKHLIKKRGGVKKNIPSFPNYEDFVKRVCIMEEFDDLAKSCKELKTPRKIIEMNDIWKFFGITCLWNNWERGLRPQY